MKKILLVFVVIIIVCLSFISCDKSQVIPEENFIKIYADMTIMQDTSALLQKQISEKVLSKYHYSENDYKKTIESYNNDPEKWTKFFDKVIEHIETLKAKTKKVKPLVLPKRYVLKDM